MSNILQQAVILAGGRGTRLKPLTDTVPKPMITFHGKPFMEYLVMLLKENGVREIVMLLGYLPDKIIDYFGDGSKLGVRIRYSVGKIEDESGTRLKNALPLLQNEFFLLYCDNYLSIDLKNLVNFHRKKKKTATVTTYSNKDGFTKNNMRVNDDGIVVEYDRARIKKGLNSVELGFFILEKKLIRSLPEGNPCFEEEMLPALSKENNLAGFLVDQPYWSIGKLERLKDVDRFFAKKKVVFLDRDGVINEKPPKAEYVKNWDEFKFLPGATEGLKLLREKGYDMYIISNQAGIARGVMTEKDLSIIHDILRYKLAGEKVYFSGFYVCPHDWDEHCECRKPKAGMFFRASREHAIDLSKAIFIGDDERDIEAGDAAGCKTFLVKPGVNLLQIAKSLP